MRVKTAANDVLAAVTVMERARDASVRLNPLCMHMSVRELQQRADMIDKVIRARRTLQLLRDRAENLQGALDRFKKRREAMRA